MNLLAAAQINLKAFALNAFLVCVSISLAMTVSTTHANPNADNQLTNKQSAHDVIKADAASRVAAAEAEYSSLVGTAKPDGFTHCQWVDPKKVKQEMSFYVSQYEDAILGCRDQWAPHTATVWRGLKRARDSSDPKDYQIALELLRSSRYQESADNSAVRQLTDKAIELFESGASKEMMMQESYFECVNWAELDPDQILSGREYKPLSKGQLAIAKGLLSCN